MSLREKTTSGLTIEDIATAIDLDRGAPELRTEFLLNAARRIRQDVAALGDAFSTEAPPVPSAGAPRLPRR
jgi:hypothetical protein